MSTVNTTSVLWNPYTPYDNPSTPMGDDLAIKDADSGLPVPVGGMLDIDGDYIQSVGISYKPLSFDYISGFEEIAFETSELYARRLSIVVVNAVFIEDSDTVDVYLVSKDINGLYTVMGSKTLTASGTITDSGGYFISTTEEFKTYGADTVKFMVTAPGGQVSVRFGVI